MVLSIIVENWITIVAIIALLMNLSTIILILQNREQARVNITWYLIGTIISISIWIFTVYLQIEHFTLKDDLVVNTIIASISNIVILLGLILMTGFAKLLIEPKLNLNQFTTLISLTGVVAGIYTISIYLAIERETEYVNNASLISNFVNLVIIILAIIFIQTDLTKLLNEDLSEKQESQIKLVNRSLLVGLVGVLPSIALATLFGIHLLAIAFIVISIALLFLIRAYVIDPRVAFILPYRTYLAIVVNKGGVLRYSKDFMGDRDITSTLLISSTLSAVTSAMSEFYDTEVIPSVIEFENKLILFNLADTFFLAVFTDRDSPLIRKAMEETMKEIELKYENKIVESMADLRLLDLDEIFAKAFYFIY